MVDSLLEVLNNINAQRCFGPKEKKVYTKKNKVWRMKV
jgi:hypothetical protein